MHSITNLITLIYFKIVHHVYIDICSQFKFLNNSAKDKINSKSHYMELTISN